MVAETGREVPAEQARADRLRVPGAGGLGVCSAPARARGDAALQTPGAELLALAAGGEGAPDCSAWLSQAAVTTGNAKSDS